VKDNQTVNQSINFLRTVTAQGGEQAVLNVEDFFIACSDPRAIGTLPDNRSYSRRQEQRLIGREATKMSGQDMETQKSRTEGSIANSL